MADLNVALILRLVDRMSAPARQASAAVRAVSAAQASVTKGSGVAARAVSRLTTSNGALTKYADLVAKSETLTGTATMAATLAMQSAAQPAAALGGAMNATAEAFSGTSSAAGAASAAVDRSAAVASGAARSFGTLTRMQVNGRLAAQSFGRELDALNDRIGKLAMGSIVTEGMDRAGRSIMGPITRSVERAAEFQKGMTGIGILADLPARQLAAVKSNILSSAQRLAIPTIAMQQDDMAVLNEGVYRRGRDLIAASQSAARLSLLSDYAGTPITGAEAGGLIATYAHSMLAPAAALDRLNATLFKASQVGGMRIGNVARFLPEIMGQMKARAFGNYQGFVDANAALQITKRLTGNDEAAGIDVKDLMLNLNHMLTDRRFAKAGLDLEAIIARANRGGVSPLVASLNAIMSKTGYSAADPNLAGKLGKFFQNAQAGAAATAIITNQRDTAAGPGFNSFRKLIAAPSDLTAYYLAIAQASQGGAADLVRLQNAQTQLAISTGTILFPAVNKLAGAMTRVADIVTRLEGQHTALARAAVYATSGLGVAALGAGALGTAVVGVVAPFLIVRSLFGRLLPSAAAAGTGRVAGLALRLGRISGPATEAATGVEEVTTALRGLSLLPLLGTAGALAALPLAGVAGMLVGFRRILHDAEKAGPVTWRTLFPSMDDVRGPAQRLARVPAAATAAAASHAGLAAAATHSRGREAGRPATVAPLTTNHLVGAVADRPPWKPMAREVHHHHQQQLVFHIHGQHDARHLAREIERHRRRAQDAALHDGGDDEF